MKPYFERGYSYEQFYMRRFKEDIKVLQIKDKLDEEQGAPVVRKTLF